MSCEIDSHKDKNFGRVKLTFNLTRLFFYLIERCVICLCGIIKVQHDVVSIGQCSAASLGIVAIVITESKNTGERNKALGT